MHPRIAKTLALLGGVATLALGTSYVIRGAASKPRALPSPCSPQLLELERAVCHPLVPVSLTKPLAERSLHARN